MHSEMPFHNKLYKLIILMNYVNVFKKEDVKYAFYGMENKFSEELKIIIQKKLFNRYNRKTEGVFRLFKMVVFQN